MSWERVERRLERAFRAAPRQFGESVVVPRRWALPLERVLEGAADDDELYGEGVAGTLEMNDAKTSLLDFYWDGFGPMSWIAGLDLVGTGRRRYLVVWDDVEGHRAVAAIEPWDDPLVVSAAVSSFLATNGRRHGDHLFGSLPHEVTNHRPDLLPTSVVRQALFDYLQWLESVDPGAWGMFASEHYGRIVEPNHLERSLDVLRSINEVGFDPWLEELERESAEMSDHERHRIFDEWFATAYRTA